MAFDRWNDYKLFSETVREKNRYIFSPETELFLRNIEEALDSRKIFLRGGTSLFRSQIGYDLIYEEDYIRTDAYSPERMIPKASFAKEGRANPKGITYLYLSSDIETSMSEMRPQIDEWLSCAEFKISRELKLVDCHTNIKELNELSHIFGPRKSQTEINEAVWYMINQAFAVPVRNSDISTDYVPTQILTELVLSKGFDGLCHRSSLSKGLNYIIFNKHYAEYINCKTYRTSNVKYQFDIGVPPTHT